MTLGRWAVLGMNQPQGDEKTMFGGGLSSASICRGRAEKQLRLGGRQTPVEKCSVLPSRAETENSWDSRSLFSRCRARGRDGRGKCGVCPEV